jgi:hypothetical protein
VALFGSGERAEGRVFGTGEAEEGLNYRVLGVAGDNAHFGLDRDPPNLLYLPMEALDFSIAMAHVAVRSRGEPPGNWVGPGRTGPGRLKPSRAQSRLTA